MKDLTGKPLSGPVEVNFAIYKEQADAAPLWQETQTLQLDEQGRYTVLLGAMQAEGLPLELFATGGARWLGIQAQGAEAQPRVLLVSVPYALKAGDAETLAGKPVSDFVLAQELKEQVQTEVAQQAKKQQDRGQQALAMVLGQGPTPMATTQGQTSFTCPSGTSGDCVGIQQDGTGRALRVAVTSTTSTIDAMLLQHSGTGRALNASANSSSEAALVQQSGSGYGLRVVSTATSGTVFAVRGESASTTGRGTLGNATATTGATIGVYGSAASTLGTGVYGEATSSTGYTYGLRSKNFSSNGTGILASALATTGTTKGLWVQVQSAGGTAAVFQNTANGKLLSGLVGTGTGTEVFSVAGNGNLLSAGTLSGTQLISTVATGTAPLQVNSTTQVTNLNASLLGGMPATAFSTILGVNTPVGAGLTGGGTTGTLTLSLLTSCASGQLLKWSGSAWRCDNDVAGSGTVTSVASGTGLTGGPVTGSGTLSLDTTYTDARYLQLTGGTLTGGLTGTTASFGGALTAGGAALPGTDTATATHGFNSYPLDLAASAFDSGSSAAQPETFRWQSEPVGNDTASPSATLNLLFGSGTTPAETGLKINADGTITFAAGQTFPGTGSGTITGVTAGTGLTGGGTIGTVTLDVNNTVVAFQSDLTTEANARQATDTALQNNINSEATARASGDTAAIATGEGYTDTAVAGEATTRAAGDAAAVTASEAYTDTASAAQTVALNTHKTSGDHDARYAQLAHANTFQLPGTAIPQVLGPVDNSSGTGGFPSNPLDLAASAWNTTGGGAAEAETFRWQAEPVGDNTATPSATLNLLYGQNTTPAETGLKINADGTITFAGGQTFPGTGTVTSVGSGTGLTGGPITSTGTLSIATGGVTDGMLANAYSGTGSCVGGFVTALSRNGTPTCTTLPTATTSTAGAVQLGGDVTGSSANLTVSGLQGVPVSSTAPTSSQVLTFNGANWTPATPSGGPGTGGTFDPTTHSSSYTIPDTDTYTYYLVDDSASGRVYTLPNATTQGRLLTLLGTTGYTDFQVQTQGSDTILGSCWGSGSYIYSWGAATFVTDGNHHWWQLNSNCYM